MRCYCCNKILSDFEATRKSVTTGEYLDMCNKCYATIKDELHAEERHDLYDGDEDKLEEQSFLFSDVDSGVDNYS